MIHCGINWQDESIEKEELLITYTSITKTADLQISYTQNPTSIRNGVLVFIPWQPQLKVMAISNCLIRFRMFFFMYIPKSVKSYAN